MVSLCIWYIESPVVHGSDGQRDWKGWQRQARGWGARLGLYCQGESFDFFSQYIYFIEVELTYNVSGAQQDDSAIYLHIYDFSDYFPL